MGCFFTSESGNFSEVLVQELKQAEGIEFQVKGVAIKGVCRFSAGEKEYTNSGYV